MAEEGTAEFDNISIETEKQREKRVEKNGTEDFPCGPVVKTPRSQCRGHGFDPWSGK